jgi:hypothetical protein
MGAGASLALAPSPVLAGAAEANPISGRGNWWHFPSLLEPGAGPWGGFEIYGQDPVSAWRSILDWMKANDMNLLITQIPPHFKDRVVMGWGFHYVLDFDEFPEARVFSADFVARNRDRVNRILDHAGKVGVAVYLHHYNYMATRPFIERHPVLLRKWRVNTNRGFKSYLSVPDRLRYLRGNVCWREKLYQQFVIGCWRELFRKMPGCTGVVSTPGEANMCYCEDCTRGARDSSTEELDRAHRANAWEVTADFCHQFGAALAQFNRKPVLRTWKAQELEGKLPTAVPKMIKYSIFDCFWGGPDPQIRRWMEKGHEVWVSKEIFGENAGAVIWNNARYFRELVETCRRMGVKNLVSHHNVDYGTASMPLKVQQLNLICFTRYLRDPGLRTDGWVDGEYEKIFGPAGARVRVGVEAYSECVLGITRTFDSSGEGFTFPAYRDFADIGKYEADQWVRNGLNSVKQYAGFLEHNAWTDGIFDRFAREGNDVFRYMEECMASAHRGMAILAECGPRIPSAARGEFEALQASARLALRMIRVMYLRQRACVFSLGVSKVSDRDTRRRLAGTAVSLLREAALEFERFREDILELPHDHIDFGRTLQVPKNREAIEFWHGINVDRMYTEADQLRQRLDELLPRGS